MSITPLSNTKDDLRIKTLFESFDQLVRDSSSTNESDNSGKRSTTEIPDSVKLKLYGYYKVANEQGLPKTPRPSVFYYVSRAKYDAWMDAGTSECASVKEAMEAYVDLVEVWLKKLGYEKEVEKLRFLIEEELKDEDGSVKESKTKVSASLSKRVPSKPKQPKYRYTPRPVITRWMLDISYRDLFFAASQCVLPRSVHGQFHKEEGSPSSKSETTLKTFYQSKIEQQWLKQFNFDDLKMDQIEQTDRITSNPSSVIVGLSVQSLLDVFLSIKSYPSGSEIIISPPFSIKGMIDIMSFTHNLKVIPLDLPQSYTIGIDLEELEKRITERTVAIVIVHPFGKMAISTSQMKQLSENICQKYSLDLLEDCGGCFYGNAELNLKRNIQLPYETNEYATISFYSFGLTHTATALGGAIAYLPNNNTKTSDISIRMKKLQHARQSIQSETNKDFFFKLTKAIVLKYSSESSYLLGLVVVLCKFMGKSYNELSTSLVKAFPVDENNSLVMKKVRETPSIGQYSLISKRIQYYKQDHVKMRIARCKEIIDLMAKKNMIQSGRVRVTKSYQTHETSDLFWMFPVYVDDPHKVCDIMMKYGFDIPIGSFELDCVDSFLSKDKNNTIDCVHAATMVAEVIYLPTHTGMNPVDITKMIEALDYATFETSKSGEPKTISCTIDKHQSKRHVKFWFSIFVSLGAILTVVKPSFTLKIVQSGVSITIQVLLFSVVFMALITYLRIKLSPVYLCSNIYARYSSIFVQSKEQFDKRRTDPNIDETSSPEASSQTPETQNNQIHLLKDLEVLRIPKIVPTPDSLSERPMAFVTGSTGFIGTHLIRTLLLNRNDLCIQGGVVLLCRPKAKRSAKERIFHHVMNDPIFSFLSKSDFDELIHVVEGDVTMPNLGLSNESLEFLATLNVTHVFHVAASVSFIQPLDNAAESIISSALQMQSLSQSAFKQPAKFIHFSTAFVYGTCTDGIVPEQLFDFGKDPMYKPNNIYESMMGTQSLAWDALRHFQFPNTYTFAKSVCEHLLLQNEIFAKNTIIVRPSIVGPSTISPYEGWSGKKPSTIVAVACLFLKYQWNLWCFSKTNIAAVPVDVVVHFTIQKAFQSNKSISKSSSSSSLEKINCTNSEELCTRSDSSDEEILLINHRKRIYNVTWDCHSPESHAFKCSDFASSLAQTGRVNKYYGSLTAYLTLNIALNLKLTKERLIFFHRLLVTGPYNVALWVMKILGMKKTLKVLKQIGPFLDLPLLFYHFFNNEFKFDSEILAPNYFSGERYMMSCMLAAENFMSKYNKYHQKSPALPVLIIAGRNHLAINSDVWWAMTQPQGNIFIRIAGYVMIKLLRCTTAELTVDVDSFRPLLESLQNQNSNNKNEHQSHLILAPTHRSIFDFLILSFVCFAIPEIGINIPHIAAADDFERLPLLGWFAKGAQAFFLRRGVGKADPELKKTITKLKDSSAKSGAVFEVFLEGKRSRDRRFVEPKTGVLRCLANTGGDHFVTPLSISYERVPEQSALVGEFRNGRRGQLNISELFPWLWRVYTGQINIGRVHVQASNPVVLTSNEINVKQIANAVQLRQKKIVLISEFHIDAGAKLLEVPSEKMRITLKSLGCKFWHTSDKEENRVTSPLELPHSEAELWSIMLQYGHWLSPLLSESHSKWAAWLDESMQGSELAGNICFTKDVEDDVTSITNALTKKLDEAENAVKETVSLLKSKGFSNPTRSHIRQFVNENHEISSILVSAAIVILLGKDVSQSNAIDEDLSSKSSSTALSSKITPLFKASKYQSSIMRNTSSERESFGAWGFEDSGFIFQIEENGARNVIMKGNRYDFSGRKMPKIVKFLEKEMDVSVDPRKTALPIINPSQNILIPDCEISSTGIAKLLNLFENDKNRVSMSSKDRVRHGTGHTQEDIYKIRTSSYQDFRVPDVVVWPINEAEVSSLVNRASKEGWCLIPFGGGTNVTHATWCPSKEVEPRPIISVDMKMMNKILWVNEEDGIAHVQAGITGRFLVSEMEKIGLTIGHEPDSIEFSTLGGWIATKASGMKQNKYGNIEDIVVNVRVSGANGLMWQQNNNDRSDHIMGHDFERVSTGIDLKSIMLGSEGSMGIITSAILKVWPVAECKEYDSVILSDFSNGIDFVRDVARLGALKPASVRLVDNEQFRMARALSKQSSGFGKMKEILSTIAASLLTSFSSDSIVAVTLTYEGSLNEVKLQKDLIQKLAKKHGAMLAGSKVGKAGYELTFAIAYLRDFAMTNYFLGESFETFVPWSKISTLVEKTKERICKEYQKRALPGRPMMSARVTQLYDTGVCVYFYFCMNFENVENPSDVYGEIEHCAREEILKEGGSLSHHHGVGKLRASFMSDVNSPHFHSALSMIKEAIDPNNIFGARNGSFAGVRDNQL